tara:strand:+ start:3949 stop:5139 length:1191 start_codon:yes stop_codon:yes gene_type:complete
MNEENKNLLSDSITSNYMLVNVTVRTYGGQRTDKSISDEVHATHNASSSTGKYVRNLFGDKCKRLKEVSTAYNSLRNFLYSRSLPWVSDNTGGQHGDRLMPVTESLQFLADFGKKKDEAIALRDAMADDIDAIINEARSGMGNIAPVLSEYPSADEFKRKFDATLDMAPVPAVSDFSRLSIPADLATGLQGVYEKRIVKQMDNARQDAVERTSSKLGNYAAQLQKEADGGTRMFQSIIDHLQREAGLLGALAASNDDADLEEIAMDILSKLVASAPKVDTLKKNPALCGALAHEARTISAKLLGEDAPAAQPVPAAPKVEEVDTITADAERAIADMNLQLSQDIERKIPTSEGGSMPDGDAHLQVDIEEAIKYTAPTPPKETKLDIQDFNPDDFML